MTKLPTALFVQCAQAVVPNLRETVDALNLPEDVVGETSVSLTATININGRDERVRVTVALNPEEDGDEQE